MNGSLRRLAFAVVQHFGDGAKAIVGSIATVNFPWSPHLYLP